MKKVFVVIGLIVLWVMAYMWLKSPAGVKQVDRVIFGQDKIDATINAQWRG